MGEAVTSRETEFLTDQVGLGYNGYGAAHLSPWDPRP